MHREAANPLAARFIRPHNDKRETRKGYQYIMAASRSGNAVEYVQSRPTLRSRLGAPRFQTSRPGPGVKKLLPRASPAQQIPPGGHTEVDTTTESTRWPRRDSSQRPLSTDQQKQYCCVVLFSRCSCTPHGACMAAGEGNYGWLALVSSILSVMC